MPSFGQIAWKGHFPRELPPCFNTASFANAARILKETGAAAVKLEGGEAMASTIAFLSQRGIPVMGHIGLTPQAVNMLGGYGARGRSEAEEAKIMADARAVDEAGAFAMVVEGVLEPIAIAVTKAVSLFKIRRKRVDAERFP